MKDVAPTQPIAAPLSKQRCPTDNAVLFHYTQQGLSFRCRHCKGVHVVSWAEIARKCAEMSEGRDASP